MTEQDKEWIDNASYYQLLKKWRFEPCRSGGWFDEPGRSAYHQEVMEKKKALLSHEECVAISKDIGWE